jgi:hypothetical protein
MTRFLLVPALLIAAVALGTGGLHGLDGVRAPFANSAERLGVGPEHEDAENEDENESASETGGDERGAADCSTKEPAESEPDEAGDEPGGSEP